jgi:DNA invertase Pin-like site-specific DNA recombinase
VAIREYEALVSRAKAGDWSGFLVDLLARQSLDDLKKHANSVVSQLVHLRGDVSGHPGCTLGQGFADRGVGATEPSEHRRLGLEQTLGRIHAKAGTPHIIAMWKWDRAQRNEEDWSRLKRACKDARCLLYCDGRIYDLHDGDDEFQAGINVLLAQRGGQAIKQNARLVVARNFEKGRPHGRPQYGYQRVYDSRTKALIGVVEDPWQAPIVRLIFRWFTVDGWARHAIAKELNVRHDDAWFAKHGLPVPADEEQRRIPPLDRRRVHCPVCEKRTTWYRDGDTPPGQVKVTEHEPPAEDHAVLDLESDEETWEGSLYCRGSDQPAAAPPQPYWDEYQVTRILRNAGYAGWRTHSDLPPVKAEWPALVSAEVFDTAQAILDDTKREDARRRAELEEQDGRSRRVDGKARHKLSGIGRCGVCGGPLRRVPNHTARPIYQCMGRGDRSLGKFCTAIAAEEFEAEVEAALIKRLSEKNALPILAGDGGGEEEISELEAEIARKESGLAEAKRALEAAGLSTKEAEDSARRDIEALRAEATRKPVLHPLVVAMATAPSPGEYWANASLEAKRAILAWVMTPYLYPKGRPGGRVGIVWRNGGSPVMIELEVRPVQIMYHQVCENPDYGAEFEGRGRYCSTACMPSNSPEARQAWYTANKDRILAERKAEREKAGPTPRARRRQEVLQLLAEEPHLSDREIAFKAGVSTQAVWKIRRATPGTRPSRQWGHSRG